MRNLEKLEIFFRQELGAVIQRRHDQLHPEMDISTQDIDYLIYLLLQYADSEKFKADFTNAPLFDLVLMRKAFNRNKIKSLADFCLFRVGFFPFAFNQRHVPPRRNFIIAGKSAYIDLSNNLHPAMTYLSLGKNFLVFANLVSELKLQSATDVDIMELCDFWEETGNLFAEEQLRKRHVVPLHLKKM